MYCKVCAVKLYEQEKLNGVCLCCMLEGKATQLLEDKRLRNFSEGVLNRISVDLYDHKN